MTCCLFLVVQWSRNVSSLTQAMISSTNTASSASEVLGSHRKRAFSTPHIAASVVHQMLATSISATAATMQNPGTDFSPYHLAPSGAKAAGGDLQNVYFYNKTASGRSSFCVEENVWKATGMDASIAGNLGDGSTSAVASSDNNIYTKLAMGDERYKLPSEFANVQSPGVSITTSQYGIEDLDEEGDDNEVDVEEASDQFSPLLYASMPQSSHPIPISPGQSPSRMAGSTTTIGTGQRTPRAHSPTNQVAYSASPAYPYTPFYSSSPENQVTAGGSQTLPPKKISFSYDPAFGSAVNRLAIPHQQMPQIQIQPRKFSQPISQFTTPIQPAHRLSTISVESAPGAIAYATSPTSGGLAYRSVETLSLETRNLFLLHLNSHTHIIYTEC